MADSDITIDDAAGTDRKVDTRTVGVDEHRQVVVIGDPTTAAGVAGADATNGVDVDVTRIAAGTNLIGKVQLSDGTSDATVRNLAANDALNVAIVDGSGAHVTSFAGSGGSSATDGAAFTPDVTAATTVMGFYQSSPSALTSGDVGAIGLDSSRRVKVSVDASTLDVAHDAADSGNPVKIGGKAQTATPTAVATGDRTDARFSTYGSLLTATIDPGQQVWKQVEATTTQTGTTIWDPTAGKKIAVTSYEIGTGGTTAALVTIWFGDNADVTFTQGTDQVLFRGTLSPSSSATPGVISNLTTPVYCTTADRELHYTTSAGITIYIVLYGFEF